MQKVFLEFERVRDNAILMASRIVEDGFFPDIIYVSLRGGAYVGNIISEYFKIVGRPPLYAAVVASSYSDVNKRAQIKIQGWTFRPEQLKPDNKILLVDDIFDSGHTINRLSKIFMDFGLLRENIRIAVHDYKERRYLREQLPVKPDYFCVHHVIEKREDDFWIHYLSHELAGLTGEEIEIHYLAGAPFLKEAMRPVMEKAARR